MLFVLQLKRNRMIKSSRYLFKIIGHLKNLPTICIEIQVSLLIAACEVHACNIFALESRSLYFNNWEWGVCVRT